MSSCCFVLDAAPHITSLCRSPRIGDRLHETVEGGDGDMSSISFVVSLPVLAGSASNSVSPAADREFDRSQDINRGPALSTQSYQVRDRAIHPPKSSIYTSILNTKRGKDATVLNAKLQKQGKGSRRSGMGMSKPANRKVRVIPLLDLKKATTGIATEGWKAGAPVGHRHAEEQWYKDGRYVNPKTTRF